MMGSSLGRARHFVITQFPWARNSLTLLRPTQPSTDSGWKMSTSYGWGSKFSCALVGLASNACRAALCAVPRTPVLPTSCQHCKATLDIVCKCRYIKNTYFTFLLYSALYIAGAAHMLTCW